MSKGYLPCQGIHVTVYDEPVVIDPLGAPTPEQVADRKAAEAPARKVLNAVVTAVAMTVVGLVLMGAGIYIGATDPDTWTQLPFTPEPSGERAEPEESAR